ncbi:MAG: zinc ribbon domain-containing protein, partial [Thermodesulfovibrionales bacterium]|nr:zinc ribbon domain-containing protein [Thermodesulfovibrionales bacterium]
LDTIFNLPGKYETISQGLMDRLKEDFGHYGLALQRLYIQSITPPEEVQKAIDDKSRLAVFDDINKLLKLKAAMALEKVSEGQSGDASNAFGMGMGFMMPAMFADFLKDKGTDKLAIKCDECGNPVPQDARFCPSCGHQLVIFKQCPSCKKNIPPSARFCPRCGNSVDSKPNNKICKNCNADNLPESVFCNQCGERL